MSGDGDKRFSRPWKDEDGTTARVVPLPVVGEDLLDDDSADEIDWESIGDDDNEDYDPQTYLRATTQEYQGLAEEVSRAAAEEWEQQAVAANLPGVESGLVGFEDVSGTSIGSEESFEAYEQAATSDLAMRIGSAIVIFGLFLGSLILGGWWFSAFVVLLMVVAVGELYATMRTRDHKPLALFGLIGVGLMGIGAHNWGIGAIAGWAGAMTLAILLYFSLTPRRDPLVNASVTVLGMAWVGLLSFAIPFAAGPAPVAYILFVVLIVAGNDVAAFFVGRAFGKRRLAAWVSPHKTVEGFIGGLIAGAMISSILVTFPAWETFGLARALVLAAIVGLFSPLGDLVESMVKRTIEVKDMGSVLPGHGGMLDRIDGLLLALPALYFAFRAFGLL